jgi:hypothetical protein
VAKYNNFVTVIDDLQLSDAADLAPLLNVSIEYISFISSLLLGYIQGREILGIVGKNFKPGPWTQLLLGKIIEWQLENPSSDKVQCETWLKDSLASGRIDIMELQSESRTQTELDEEPAAKKKKRYI